MNIDSNESFGLDYGRFLRALRITPLHDGLSPSSFARIFEIEIEILPGAIQTTIADVLKEPEEEEVQLFMCGAVRIVLMASKNFLSIDKAIIWFKNERIAALDEKTAQQLLFDERTDDVIRYLESLSAGFTG